MTRDHKTHPKGSERETFEVTICSCPKTLPICGCNRMVDKPGPCFLCTADSHLGPICDVRMDEDTLRQHRRFFGH